MAVCTIKFFNWERGYGFIEPDDGGPDVFVHVADVQKSDLDTRSFLISAFNTTVATNSRNGSH